MPSSYKPDTGLKPSITTGTILAKGPDHAWYFMSPAMPYKHTYCNKQQLSWECIKITMPLALKWHAFVAAVSQSRNEASDRTAGLSSTNAWASLWNIAARHLT